MHGEGKRTGGKWRRTAFDEGSGRIEEEESKKGRRRVTSLSKNKP